jgi:general secretion pathway protein M
MSSPSTMTSLRAWWERLSPQERGGLQAAAALLALLVLWFAIIGPGIQTWRTAEAKGKILDAQLQQMQSMQTQAMALQAQPTLSYDDALRALTQSTQQTLGASSQVSVTGERATVSVQSITADALAQWLAQVRLNARAVPAEVHLSRAIDQTTAVWSGTLVMNLPAR